MNKLFYVIAVALILAVFPLPIGYYTLLRILVSIGAVIFLVKEFKGEFELWIIVFGIMLIVFNPLIPIYLYSKALWIPIDLAAAGIFAYWGYKADSAEKEDDFYSKKKK